MLIWVLERYIHSSTTQDLSNITDEMILQEILSTISDFSYFESYCQFPTLSNKLIL